MGVYVVRYLTLIIGISARLQGAELIKANWIDEQARDGFPVVPPLSDDVDKRRVLERTTKIEPHDVQDME